MTDVENMTDTEIGDRIAGTVFYVWMMSELYSDYDIKRGIYLEAMQAMFPDRWGAIFDTYSRRLDHLQNGFILGQGLEGHA